MTEAALAMADSGLGEPVTEPPSLKLISGGTREFATRYKHYLAHGMCYKNECVELYGPPLEVALGSLMLHPPW